MTAAAVETSDVIVTGHRIPVEELIRVQKSVCLLRSSTKSSRYEFEFDQFNACLILDITSALNN